MRGERRPDREERLAGRRLPDEVGDTPVGFDRRVHALREGFECPVVTHVESVVGALVTGKEREPFVPAGWTHGGVDVPIEVLAEQAGAVAGVVEPRRERRRIIERSDPTEGALVRPDPVRV
jgi:hypothetical protein